MDFLLAWGKGGGGEEESDLVQNVIKKTKCLLEENTKFWY